MSRDPPLTITMTTESARLSVYESVFREDVKRLITGTLKRDVGAYVKSAYVNSVRRLLTCPLILSKAVTQFASDKLRHCLGKS